MSPPIRILLVDDDRDDYENTRDVLDHIPFERELLLEWVPRYDDALAVMRANGHDVCLLDYYLGARHGVTFLGEALGLGSTIPVILLTGRSDRAIEQSALAAGACDYLLKTELEATSLERAIRHSIERGKILTELRASERRFRSLFDSSVDAMWITDDDARFVDVNPAALALLGATREQLLARVLSDFAISVDDQQALSRALASTGSYEQLVAMKRVDGQLRATELRAVANIVPGHHLSVARDITDKKRLEQQLAISSRMVSVGTLAAGVVHEINNPLAAVMANLELADDELGKLDAHLTPTSLAAARELLADARRGSECIRNIVRDLKLFSRPDEELREPMDVRKALDSAIRMASNEIKHRATLVCDFEETPSVWGNSARLGQVFLNLIINAAHAVEAAHAEQPQISIRTRVDPAGRIVVELQDTGCGILAEHLPLLFDPFFTTKPIGIGTGLGLSICQRIVHEHDGSIEVESVVGQGSTFRVTLPPSTQRMAVAPRAPHLAIAPTIPGRILVIDDEPMIAAAVQRCLRRDHLVTVLHDARTALEHIVAGERFDLILCDVMMPHMTGMDLHRALAASLPQQAAAMVFLTGGAFTESAMAFLASVENQRVDKPFSNEELRALANERVRRVVAERQIHGD